MDKESDIIEKRKKKNEDLLNQGINLFPNDFKVSNTIKDFKATVDSYSSECHEGKEVLVVAGRMMAINRFGKASFIRIKDRTGLVQAYIAKEKVGENSYALFKQLDVGDFVGIKGSPFKTKTGEWTLLATEISLLCKATKPLPEKFHGLKDPEKRYRQRYIDLIMNSEVRDIFIKRSKIVQAVRAFLLSYDFLEVETPMMQPIPGGAEAAPFVTHHKTLDMNMYLRIAPELYLKRLVVGGFERVFEINRNFRNEGVSTQHNPEFTMMEFYMAYATYLDLMTLTEEMFRYVAKDVVGSDTFLYQENNISFSGTWKRIPLLNSLIEIGGVPENIINDKAKLLDFASSKGIKITNVNRFGKIITKLFDVLVEPKLIQPTFITGYPVEVSPLSRKSDENKELTDRFELFIAGREIANGFSELNDPIDQKYRFMEQLKDREAGDEEAHHMDEDYIEALEYGMPPTAGEGIGIDRLVMLLTNSPSIREVILFPHMRTKN
ncbi:MAG: lysine--tRNA ligase [Desulfobacterales bacterium]|nr:lysine--tRNA ligase [Desulfobacterales bacterium]MBF0398543.1 lysine--tRNA ligase [Desulfobacterales bacterium]